MRSSMETDTQCLFPAVSWDRTQTPDILLQNRKQPLPTVAAVDRTNLEVTSTVRRPRQISWVGKLQGTWIPELLGLLCSAVALIAIAIILLEHDNKRRPAWRISLNAVVSMLSAVVTAGAVYSVTHGVSQLKWTWLSEKERKLADIQTFDSGSRGAVGAIALVLHLRARHLAALGAIAIVLCTVIDPSIQNVIQFRDGVMVDETQASYAAKASIYKATGIPTVYGAIGTNFALKSCLYSAVHGNKQKNTIQPQHLCQTGNCTWDRFATLAFCPKCVDVSKYLEHTCKDQGVRQYCMVSFPGGSPSLGFDATLGYYFSGMVDSYFSVKLASSSIVLDTTGCLQSAYETGRPFVWHSIRADVDFEVLSKLDGKRKIGNDTAMIGTECAMYPCVLSIDAEVKNGQYQEDVVDEYYFPKEYFNRTAKPKPDGTEVFQSYETVKMIGRPPWGEEKGVKFGETFGMTTEAYKSASVTIGGFLLGHVEETDAGSGMAFTSDELQAVFSAKYTNETCDTPRDNFACAFKAIGHELSNTIRDVSIPLNGSTTPDVVVGKTFVGTTFVKVEWMWLSLPVAVWILALIVWLGTIWKSWAVGAPLWRDDVLPLIFASQEIKNIVTKDEYHTSSAIYTMKAQEVRVKLVNSGGQFDLVKQ